MDKNHYLRSKTGIFLIKDEMLIPMDEYPAGSNGSFDSIDEWLGYKHDELHMICMTGKKIELMFCRKYERIPLYVVACEKSTELSYEYVKNAFTELEWARELLLQIALYRTV